MINVYTCMQINYNIFNVSHNDRLFLFFCIASFST